MSAPLARLLKLRRVLEELSRADLQGRSALAARVGQIQERERQRAHEGRERAFKEIIEDGAPVEQAEQRVLEWSGVEDALWRERQLEPVAQAALWRVAEGREEFFARRKERKQVQSVLEMERAQRRIERERRIQRELDDWFGMRRIHERGERRGPGS